MTTEALTCPYCNASIGPQTVPSTGDRIICPRCGDAFAVRPGDRLSRPTPETASPPAADAYTPAEGLSLRSRWPNRLIGGAVLGVMLLMAGAGLAFMLLTQGERRAHDTSRPARRPGRQPGVPEPELPAIAAVAPDRLTALTYLPSGVNFIAGVRVPELAASPVGRQLLADPLQFGNASLRLDRLPSWVGLRLEDIDHLVVAARVDRTLPPPFYLVLRTAQPYEGESLRRRLKAVRAAGTGKKELYSFRKDENGINLHVWFADERTLVVSLFPDQLESLLDQPAEDLRRLPEEVRTILQTRREPVAPIWAVGHSRDWSKTTAGAFLAGAKKDDLRRLSVLRSFGVWLVPDESLAVKGVFECKDEAAAGELDAYFRSLAESDPAYRSALDGPWLTLQYRAGADFLTRLTKR